MKIGISGHQVICPESSLEWVEATLRAAMLRQHASAGVSCLAAGTDQIFASIALGLGMDLEVIIPCDGYEGAFDETGGKVRYTELLGSATRVHRLDFQQPSQEAFLCAGKRVVDICDGMLFVWDGTASEGCGGTADIVAYARLRAVPFIWLNPVDSAIQTSNSE